MNALTRLVVCGVASALLLTGCSSGITAQPGTYAGVSQNFIPSFQIQVVVGSDGSTITSINEAYQGCAKPPDNAGYKFVNLTISADGTFDSGTNVDGERIRGQFDGAGHVVGLLTDLNGGSSLPEGCRVRQAPWAASVGS